MAESITSLKVDFISPSFTFLECFSRITVPRKEVATCERVIHSSSTYMPTAWFQDILATIFFTQFSPIGGRTLWKPVSSSFVSV